MINDTCLDLERALKLSATFSAHSMQGAIPNDLLVPVPSEAFCAFIAKPWAAVSDMERDAFRAFYACVGDKLEDVAEAMRNRAGLDEERWTAIVAQLHRVRAA